MVAAPQGTPPRQTAAPVPEMALARPRLARRIAWFALGGVGILIVAFLAIQFVPYGRAHTNPPVVQEPAWDSPQTRALFVRACNDCHSNQTEWSRLNNVAPLSWLAQWAIDEGRTAFNVSEWPSDGHRAANVAGSVQSKQMPPEIYVSLNPDALLTPAEQQELIRGLRATFGDH